MSTPTLPLFLVLSGSALLAEPTATPLRPAGALPLQGPAETEEDTELTTRLATAGEDAAELWKVAEWAKGSGRRPAAREICATIIGLEPDHAAARKLLGHQHYDDQWFESYTALSAYKRAEDKRMLEEHGLARFGDGWAPPADIPFLRMKWTKGEDGTWASPRRLEARAQEAKYAEEGWRQQADLVWVPPDEVGQWDQGLWKCGDEWLATPEADAYHARLDRPWTLPGENFVVSSTLPMEKVAWAKWWADQTAGDLQRAYGRRPADKPVLEVLASTDEYNRFSGANPPPEADGLSSIHYAYFAESWFDRSPPAPEYKGRGVCYWDHGNESLAGFGQFAVRHAAGQSYAEAIDPSWDTVSRWSTGSTGATAAFWREKRIPRWLRYGVASYVERYFIDHTVGEDGNPRWAREWALENLRRAGGLGALKDVFAFRIGVQSPEQAAASAKLIHEAGCLVMFMLDGGSQPVTDAHRAFLAALNGGGETTEAVNALQAALLDQERALRRFAQL